MSRILITGAGGFIGSHLVAALQTRHDVTAIAFPPPQAAPGRAAWIAHDLAQPLENAALPEKVDAVVHLAQSRFYRDFPARADDIFMVNVQSTLRLLDYARRAGARSFLLASTGGLYGYGDRPFVETDPVTTEKFIEADPRGVLNFYFASKYMAELLAANYRAFFNTVILRLFFIYGPGQKGMLISNLVQRIRARQPVTIQGNPGLRINPTHVSDVVRAIELALSLPEGGVFNIAGDEVVSITDLVTLIAELAGEHVVISHSEAALPGDLVGDNTRMRRVLGVTPQTGLRSGLAELVHGKEG